MKSLLRFSFPGLAVLALALSPAARAATPTVIPLNIDWSYPQAMNASGQFIGSGYDQTTNQPVPFFVDPSTGVQLMGSFGAGPVSPAAISDAGVVTGNYPIGRTDPWGNQIQHAFVWTPSTGYQDLGNLGSDWVNATGNSQTAINRLGHVVGYAEVPDTSNHAFFWNGTIHDIGTLGGSWSYPDGMNNRDQVVGPAMRADGTWAPFIWDLAHGIREIPAGQDYAQPYGINDNSVVFLRDPSGHSILVWDEVNGTRVFADPDDGISPFFMGWQLLGFMDDGRAVFRAERMFTATLSVLDPVNGWQRITVPGGNAVRNGGFSKSGYVVATAQLDTGESVGFIWHQTKGIQFIPSFDGGNASYPAGVNDFGQVTGSARTASGEPHAFIWDAVNGIQDLGVADSPDSTGTVIQNGALAGYAYKSDYSSYHGFYAKLDNPTTTADTQAPVITSLSASPNVLWPANKKMVAVTITAVATDNVAVKSLKIVSVTSSEAATSFYTLTGDLKLTLLADRAGNGPGRTYTIKVEAADAAGNKSTKTCTVLVPHDQGK